MSTRILIVDDMDRFHAVTEAALKGLEIEIDAAKSVAIAKRKLLDHVPAVILCSFSFRNSSDGGAQFSAELRKHPTLAGVPILLIANELNDGLIRKASDSGAQGLIAWPIPVGALRNRIRALLPSGEATTATPGTSAPSTSASASAVVAEQKKPPSTRPLEPVDDPKLQLAQRLLAQVLHNIRTSDLLRVIDLEDVPRAVFEITRTICGIKGEKKADEKNTSDEASNDEMNLDALFGQKKR